MGCKEKKSKYVKRDERTVLWFRPKKKMQEKSLVDCYSTLIKKKRKKEEKEDNKIR